MSKGRGLVRQWMVLAGLGIGVWAVAILFFVLFGDYVLLEVGDPYFGASLFLLEMLAFLLLIGMALVVRLKLFHERGSATRFAFVATAVGLLLNTAVVWHRQAVFPAFSEGQHHAFTVWMTLAFALALVVPAVMDRLVRESLRQVDKSDVQSESSMNPADSPALQSDATE
ncbi:hypothetical protein SD71_11070 [Cohnella kolymensis]|uniref:Uncharacterized protein n=1 Tax=Cohnella kolymensis TaxID=1590652 RepID=A0ABR5A4J2_9BACL|nr:hypothetical protein [Cohnella kolymensis]KIL35915.1 hypothetical protein SD71_11070 [Cohnella kolymensis]